MQPTTLPGRSYVSVGSERKSRLLFHWRARDFSLNPLAGQSPTFVRATAGGAVIGSNGRLRTPVHSQPRYEMVDFDGDGIRETAVLLLEPQRTQLHPEPQSPNSWTNIGTPIVTTGLTDPWGGSTAILIEDNDAAATEGKTRAIAFTGDGTKSVMPALRAGTLAEVRLSVQDVTAGGSPTRAGLRVTWNGGTVPPTTEIYSGSGTPYPPIAVFDRDGNLWWLLPFAADNVVAANTNQLNIWCGFLNADVGTVYLAGANAWDSPIPSSWIATAATVRNMDELRFTHAAPPQVSTFYAKFRELALPQWVFEGGASPRIISVGATNGANPRCMIYKPQGSSNYTLQIEDASGNVASSVNVSPTRGDLIEVRGVFRDAGGGSVTLQLGVSKNGAPEVLGSISAAKALPSAWSDTVLHLGGLGSIGAGSIALQTALVAAGERTMQQMREAF